TRQETHGGEHEGCGGQEVQEDCEGAREGGAVDRSVQPADPGGDQERKPCGWRVVEATPQYETGGYGQGRQGERTAARPRLSRSGQWPGLRPERPQCLGEPEEGLGHRLVECGPAGAEARQEHGEDPAVVELGVCRRRSL
ncbi:hypothetical protein LTR16_005823, partial [Cryomyces antarcticus]